MKMKWLLLNSFMKILCNIQRFILMVFNNMEVEIVYCSAEDTDKFPPTTGEG